MDIIFIGLFFLIPTAFLVWFIVELALFSKTPKELVARRNTHKTLAIVSGAIAGVLLASVAAIAIMFTISIRHM